MAERAELGLTAESSHEDIQSLVKQMVESAFQDVVLNAEQNTTLQEIIDQWVQMLI